MAFFLQNRVRLGIGLVLILIVGAGAWLWATAGRESTDDAQADARVTQIAARVSGTITKVAIDDNQLVEQGTLLVELDPRDYQVAVDKARAELADAEAAALAASSNVPITSPRRQAMSSRRAAASSRPRAAGWGPKPGLAPPKPGWERRKGGRAG